MVKLTLWLGFFLRLVNAFVNGFYGPSYGASDDALGFHLSAVEHSQNLVFDGFVKAIYIRIFWVFSISLQRIPCFWEALYLL